MSSRPVHCITIQSSINNVKNVICSSGLCEILDIVSYSKVVKQAHPHTKIVINPRKSFLLCQRNTVLFVIFSLWWKNIMT